MIMIPYTPRKTMLHADPNTVVIDPIHAVNIYDIYIIRRGKTLDRIGVASARDLARVIFPG